MQRVPTSRAGGQLADAYKPIPSRRIFYKAEAHNRSVDDAKECARSAAPGRVRFQGAGDLGSVNRVVLDATLTPVSSRLRQSIPGYSRLAPVWHGRCDVSERGGTSFVGKALQHRC